MMHATAKKRIAGFSLELNSPANKRQERTTAGINEKSHQGFLGRFSLDLGARRILRPTKPR
jgi:hypothetical protein